MDQTKGEVKSGSHIDCEENGFICQINNASILAEAKIEIMQGAVAECPKVCISAHGIQIPHCFSSPTWEKHILPNVKLVTAEKHMLSLYLD